MTDRTETCPYCGLTFKAAPSSVVWGVSTVGRHVTTCRDRTDADRAYYRTHRYWPRKVRTRTPRLPDAPPARVRLPVYRGPDF